KPITYSHLLLREELTPHLYEVDEAANNRLHQLMPALAKEAGATEQLKAEDMMRWVGLMNACKAQAEEIIFAELIYV
ncbi:MAG: TnpV protein, partial [Hydrogeniiclostridium sp.]